MSTPSEYTIEFPAYDDLLTKGKEIALVVKHATRPLQWEGTLFIGPVITASEFFKNQNMKTQEAMDYIHDLLMYGVKGHPDIYTTIRVTGYTTLSVKCVAKNTQVSVSLSLSLNTTVSLQGTLERLEALEKRVAGLDAVFATMVSQNVQIVATEAPAGTAGAAGAKAEAETEAPSSGTAL